ncbi:Xaa-Pro peptidase family protein [Xinfangfangia sp. CPCC 101601]|uniref:Xaa-Pro peptidase family protein n=1 Tax=Pseudogemmobacter lacusdianii TaxID=3069608 RepID=A0ABU0W2E2_9RHOB|nr:Xaa-Pro peptidase family protein [Xinfangfangia sp. CPCC 101601]MDQ2068132.1 Xaa-Pro peptidase family protein [Xinfangfangia sp. CPCC 101601]
MTDFATALARFEPVVMPAIQLPELEARLSGLQALMRGAGIKAVWLDASSSLTYYTGLTLGLSERIHGALVPSEGALIYVSPKFEEPKLLELMKIPARIAVWEEHEDPYALMAAEVSGFAAPGQGLALDPATPFVFASALMQAVAGPVTSAQGMISAQRQIKSPAELALIQTAMTASHSVHKAVHAGLRAGVSTTEVQEFILEAHRALGLKPLFAAVQFGEATAYPHGVPHPQILADGDMVLVDMGGTLHGYCSDITRTYVFGTPTDRQHELWEVERRAHAAAFAAAQIGASCASVDAAARKVITDAGFGPGYAVPGLPHRTGHGLGLDIHEAPYIVGGNATPLAPGMCFSIEPMLCVYGECGVRLEDIVYMTEDGPRWFAPPAERLDDPFGATL